MFNESLRQMLLAAPDSQLDASMFPLIQSWHQPPTALQILEVLDKCVFSSLASGFVITLLEMLYEDALKTKGLNRDTVEAQATWRKNW